MAKGHVLSRVPKWVQSQLHIYLAYTVKFSRQNGQVSCCGRQCWSTVAEQRNRRKIFMLLP
jgi:hypothetical protein